MAIFRTFLISFAIIASYTEALLLKCEKTNRPVCFVESGKYDSNNQTITLDTDKNPADITEIAIKRMNIGRIPTELFSVYPNIIVLNLKGSGLKTLEGIALAKNVKDLTVERNKIPEINNGQLTPCVQELQAGDNKITNIEENALRYIVHVELAYNKLKELPTNVFNKSIKMITLNHNELENVDELFKGLSKLKYLDVSHNKIRQISEDAFHNCVELNILELSDNLLETIPKNLFADLIKLNKIYLYKNFLRVLDLSMNCAKCEVNAEHNLLTSVLFSTTSHNPTIIFMDMGENAITEVHAGKNVRFSEVHLKNNQLTTFDISEDQNDISIVEFSHNDLSHMAASEFFKIKQATIIHLENCSLSVDAVKAVLSLAGQKFLVDLAYNPSVGTLNWKELTRNPDIYGLKVDACHIANVDVNDMKVVLPQLDKVEASSNKDDCANVEKLYMNLRSVNVSYTTY